MRVCKRVFLKNMGLLLLCVLYSIDKIAERGVRFCRVLAFNTSFHSLRMGVPTRATGSGETLRFALNFMFIPQLATVPAPPSFSWSSSAACIVRRDIDRFKSHSARCNVLTGARDVFGGICVRRVFASPDANIDIRFVRYD